MVLKQDVHSWLSFLFESISFSASVQGFWKVIHFLSKVLSGMVEKEKITVVLFGSEGCGMDEFSLSYTRWVCWFL